MTNTLSTWRPRLGLSIKDFFEPWGEWFQNGTDGALTVPKVNIADTKESYNLTLAAPGLSKSDFKVDVNNGILTISAEKEENKEEKEKEYTSKEYNYSSFSRSFTLPEEVEQDKIDASYENGILKLVLPKNQKSAQKAGKTISVK